MSINTTNQVQSEEIILLANIAEIENLAKLIDGSLAEIKLLQDELMDLEADLNNFLDHYYGPSAMFFKDSNTGEAVNNEDFIQDLDQAKKNIYEKIAKVCSKDAFHFAHNHVSDVRNNLLKIEGYLSDGTEETKSPQEMLAVMSTEYNALMQLIFDIKEERQASADKPAFELKQEVLWANIKKAEIISKIKEDITHQVNRHN